MLISSARSATYLEYLVYFMAQKNETGIWYLVLGIRLTPKYQVPSTKYRLVIRPSIPERLLALIIFPLIGPFWTFGLFLRLEDALFRASDAPMRVQTFEYELCRGNQHLWPFLGFDADRCEFLRESLDILEPFQNFLGACGIGQLDLAAQFKPLHHLLHVQVFEVDVVGF